MIALPPIVSLYHICRTASDIGFKDIPVSAMIRFGFELRAWRWSELLWFMRFRGQWQVINKKKTKDCGLWLVTK